MREWYLIKNRYLLLVIYNIIITILTSFLATLYINTYKSPPLSFWVFVIVFLYFSYFFYKKQVINVPVKKMIILRLWFFIVITLIYPWLGSLDLTGEYEFNSYQLIDNENCSEIYFMDNHYYPIGVKIIGTGCRSDIRYFVSKNEDISKISLKEGEIEWVRSKGYVIYRNHNLWQEINTSYITSKEMAAIYGYSAVNIGDSHIYHFSLPFKYLWYILLKEGIYTFFFSVFILIYAKKRPDKIFI